MAWKGKFFGALIGLMVTRNVWGAVMGFVIGHMFDQSVRLNFATGSYSDATRRTSMGGASQNAISALFFRITFELMGHVAKSDGRVSEAEIDAARRLMQELRLGPNETAAAITCFRTGKSANYAASEAIEQLREACAMRHDLLRAFMELQLRAALAGNGISPPARMILTRTAERLGISGLEFAYMEAALRARQPGRGGQAGRPPQAKPLSESYAELEADESLSDQEVTKAYRRQMSRHHPDKLVANGFPESMAQAAKEKTQRIQEAYETIRAARGMR
jgi:DnaJ like chaperone protein